MADLRLQEKQQRPSDYPGYKRKEDFCGAKEDQLNGLRAQPMFVRMHF
jgi:hypothetical protein